MNVILDIEPPKQFSAPVSTLVDDFIRCLEADVWPSVEALLLYGIFTTEQLAGARQLIRSGVVGKNELADIEANHARWNIFLKNARMPDYLDSFTA